MSVDNVQDTIIVPVREQDDVKILKMKTWFGVRISSDKLDRLKYIAFYQTAPKSRILYYAKLKKTPKIKNDGYHKYKFSFSGKVKTLNNIYVKDKHTKDIIIRTVRYTNFEKLNNKNNHCLREAFE